MSVLYLFSPESVVLARLLLSSRHEKKKYVCLQLIFVPPLFRKMHQCNNSTVNDTNSGFPFSQRKCVFLLSFPQQLAAAAILRYL